MPAWSPQGQHAERLRQAADAAATNAAAPACGAVDDWMRRFGAPAPAATTAPTAAPAPASAPAPVSPADPVPVHHWRQNFNPGDFLPFQYDVERHLRRMGLGAEQDVPREPVASAATPVPLASVIWAPLPIINPLPAPVPATPQATAGNGTLGMDEFLRLYPHVGVRPHPSLSALVNPVGYLFQAHKTAPATVPCLVLALRPLLFASDTNRRSLSLLTLAASKACQLIYLLTGPPSTDLLPTRPATTVLSAYPDGTWPRQHWGSRSPTCCSASSRLPSELAARS